MRIQVEVELGPGWIGAEVWVNGMVVVCVSRLNYPQFRRRIVYINCRLQSLFIWPAT